MKIKAVTIWYNEEMIAPFFLKHYSYLSEIIILVDTDTKDKTVEIIKSFPNTTINFIVFPDKLNDIFKSKALTMVANNVIKSTDWLYVLDSDEFIFPPGMESVETFLSRQDGNVVRAKMWQIYKHVTELPLNPDKIPIIKQRRHGDPNREGPNRAYNKPIIIKSPLTFRLSPGNHWIYGNGIKFCNEHYDGAHWAMADVSMAISRRIYNGKERQSRVNLSSGYGKHNWEITEQDIQQKCKHHENDPLLFF